MYNLFISNSDMKKFLLYCAIFVLPFLVILLPYFITDPFKVIYHYENYYAYEGNEYYINTNRGFVSTQMYIQNNDKYHYDSFIFGSSRSHVFCIDEWKKYIGDSTSCFHFDGYGESLFLVHAKIKFIDSKSHIRNVLIPMDYEMLSQTEPSYGHLWVTHPALIKGNSVGAFHMAHIRTYLNPKFLSAYWDLLLSGQTKPYMYEDEIIEKADTFYNLAYNERSVRYPVVKQYSDEELGSKVKQFPERPDMLTYYPRVIEQKQKKMLSEMHNILEKHGADYRILINPIYDQKLFAPEDMAYLMDLFGEHLVNFSGKNIFTDDYHYYSDPSHFNTYVSNEMLRIAYEPDPAVQQNLLDSLYHR